MSDPIDRNALERCQASQRQTKIDRERSIEFFERILAENPDNEAIRAGLEWLKSGDEMPPCVRRVPLE